MTDTLVAFLRARLDEDERVAREAMREMTPGGFYVRSLCIHLPPEVVQHNDRHDPARVLAEVEAKRRVVDASNIGCPTSCQTEHAFSGSCSLRWMGPAYEADGQRWVRDEDGDRTPAPPVVPVWALRCLALPYADHPDYRAEWRP